MEKLKQMIVDNEERFVSTRYRRRMVMKHGSIGGVIREQDGFL